MCMVDRFSENISYKLFSAVAKSWIHVCLLKVDYMWLLFNSMNISAGKGQMTGASCAPDVGI